MGNPGEPDQRMFVTLKELGYQAKVVERWNLYARVRQDVWGGDILAVKVGQRLLAVQCTSASNHAAHRTKLEAGGFIALRKGADASLEIWSWAK